MRNKFRSESVYNVTKEKTLKDRNVPSATEVVRGVWLDGGDMEMERERRSEQRGSDGDTRSQIGYRGH